MSTNSIYNGDFNLPVRSTNSFIQIFSQNADLYWSFIGMYVYIINGSSGLNHLNPSLIGLGYTQCLGMFGITSITQSFSITNTSSYKLTFYYCQRTGYPLNNLQIYLNSVLIDTITTTPTTGTWGLYSSYITTILGVNTLTFQCQDADTFQIAITGVQVAVPTNIAPTIVVTTYNSLQKSYIFGGLNVYDYLPKGGTITNIGTITTQQTFNYNYSVLPTYTSTSLGYIYSYTNTATTVAINTFTNSSAFVLPIGIYIVNAYARFTPGSSAVHTLKLGISTISGALTLFNYTIENTLVASILPHSINYTHYLSVTPATTYYFVFNTNLAGNLNGTLNGKFIRIA